MKLKYAYGLFATQIYRLLKVFPNSDPIMGFILPAAKNEPAWKAPLFAFASMFLFDIITQQFGIWTYVTSITYALIALFFTQFLKSRKAGIKTYTKAGLAGILAFDLITGPVMGTVIYGQSFILTTILQIPFTIMHLVSTAFAIVIITPLLDENVAKEMNAIFSQAKSVLLSWRIQL